jgi:hypothetical protein
VAIWEWRRKKRQTDRIPVATKEPAVNRRGAIRFPCNFKVTFRPIALLEPAPVPARVLDLSSRGIGLISGVPFSSGTFVVISLPSANGGLAAKKPARIVRLAPAEGNRWLLGCVFMHEMADDEIKTYVS